MPATKNLALRAEAISTLKECGWTNRQIAKALDISPSTVSKFANLGHCHYMDIVIK